MILIIRTTMSIARQVMRQILCILAVLTLVSTGAGADPESAVPIPPIEESSRGAEGVHLPSEIDKPGVYQADLSSYSPGSGVMLLIHSDDVILDGMGSVLTGPGQEGERGIGISITDPGRSVTNVTIMNITLSGFQSGITAEDVRELTIRDCAFRQNTQTGISLTRVSDVLIERVESSKNLPPAGSNGGGGLIVTNSDSVTIRDCRILSNGRGDGGDGIAITDSTRVAIERSTVSQNAKAGIRASLLPSGLVIRENVVQFNSGNGISMGPGCDGAIIAENRLENNVIAALEITRCQNGILTGNHGSSGRIGISLSESEGFSLSSNRFEKNSINIDITGSNASRFDHLIDRSNLADGRPILYLVRESDIAVNAADNPACVYLIHCTGISVSDLVLSGNGAGVFLVDSHDTQVSRVASLNNAYGIRTGYGSSGIQITSCNAEKNMFAGYAIASSEDVIIRSSHAQENLIGFLFAGSNRVTCEACHASGQQGLRKRGPSGFQITGCREISVINSSATKNQFDGVYLKDSPETRISGVSMTSNDIAGIAILSDGVFLANSTISENSAAGILMYGNHSQVTGNRISGNAGRGLLLDGTVGNSIWNNLLNNSRNMEISGVNRDLRLNVTPQPGLSVIGTGLTGGNYWSLPDGRGFSEICVDEGAGFCGEPLTLSGESADYHPLTKNSHAHAGTEDSRIQPAGPRFDCNGNGWEDLQDVVCLMELIGSDGQAGSERDINQDGRVNLRDVVSLFERISS